MAHHELLSPLPGIFYRRANPDAQPYAREGDTIAAGDTIGLIEAMKQFCEVSAEVGGTVVQFHAENEDAVEAGQTLATIDD
jgi:acetyl-CoA carboxylase biotin carboxyl carrier protein